jgi:chromosome segregation ATPase
MKNLGPLLLAIVALCGMGLGGGCTHQKAVSPAKVKELEVRFAKLEEDYRAVSQYADATKKKLAAAEARRAEVETQRDDLSRQVDLLKVERDDLKSRLARTTTDRDAMQNSLTQLRGDLQNMLGRVEAALNQPSGPGVTATPVSRKVD